jgi:rhodanese-related sulfurtransferase
VIEHIDADTLAVRMAAWKTVVVDVRGANALQAGRIPEAILIPENELSTCLRGLPLETSLTLVCETGAQATLAAGALWDYGFRKIAVLKGGFAGYSERGCPVRTP